VIEAEASDLFDVLAYVAQVRPPETREDVRYESASDGVQRLGGNVRKAFIFGQARFFLTA